MGRSVGIPFSFLSFITDLGDSNNLFYECIDYLIVSMSLLFAQKFIKLW